MEADLDQVLREETDMKKAKYYITFNGYDTLRTKIEINKNEYIKIKDDLTDQVRRSKDAEGEPRRTISEEDLGSYIQTVVWFNVATSDIVLTKLECKPGFQFSK